MLLRRLFFVSVFCCVIVTVVSQRATATPVIVETAPLTAEEQKAQFHLPEGFEIQLVVAEPEIGQPMQMNFDAMGRLWLSHSVDYPHPARGEGVQPRDLGEDEIRDEDPADHVSCIEGIGPDGKAAKVTHFLSGLNIPIGQIPIVAAKKGTAIVSYSIPSIRLCRDVDGDGVAETNKVLFTGFGNVDTHGMCSSFTRGFDGWIYGTHGFRNTSRIATPDGGELVLNSGNTYRFKPDGSAIEQFTWGQVNPFGMAFDTWGNLYDADCHSQPITMLIPGSYYESFGKPNDGLGFGPNMIDHNHGSTGICGVAYYDAKDFPEDYRNCIYICNPVNGQVHRDILKWKGSSPHADTQPDFITCDDGWFRPVDVKLGPDGALYVADFYNAIIGHYEAPLKHPKRGKGHGRVWRVVWRGAGSPKEPTALPSIVDKTDSQLIELLGDDNFTVRTLATNLLADRYAPAIASKGEVSPASENRDPRDVLKALKTVLAASGDELKAVNHRVHAGWVYDRLSRSADLSPNDEIRAMMKDSSPIVRAHAARMLAAHSIKDRNAAGLALELLHDADPRVQRGAAEALGRHTDSKSLVPLLDAIEAAPSTDEHLIHTLKIAVRNQLRDGSNLGELLATLSEGRQEMLADLSTSVHPASASLVEWLHKLIVRKLPDARGHLLWLKWVPQVARYSDDVSVARLTSELRKHGGLNPANQIDLIRAIQQGRQAAGMAPPPELVSWAELTASELFKEESKSAGSWSYRPLAGRPNEQNPFVSQLRVSGDEVKDNFFSTLPSGEQRTGIFRSPVFPLPHSLSFWMAGHDGEPPAAIQRKNMIRLIDASQGNTSGNYLREESPPRNDVAQPYTWTFGAAEAGRPCYLEIVDADGGGAYAWLAVGRFSIAELNPRWFDPGETAVSLVRDMHLAGLIPELKKLAGTASSGPAREKAVRSLLLLEPDARSSVLLPWAVDPATPDESRERAYLAIVDHDGERIEALVRSLVNSASVDGLKLISDSLASDIPGAELLLALVADGKISARVLQQLPMQVRLKALKIEGMESRIESLTRSLPPADEQIAKLIQVRREGFKTDAGSVERGHAVFAKRCTVCHQVGTEGKKIGPQLDGIGVRGLDRLSEDMLDPNRNVDAAFRSSTLALADGRVLTGLKRREEGTDLVLADQEGKEFRVPLAEIDDNKLSPISLMPANFGEQVPQEEFNDLMAWLLSQRPAN